MRDRQLEGLENFIDLMEGYGAKYNFENDEYFAAVRSTYENIYERLTKLIQERKDIVRCLDLDDMSRNDHEAGLQDWETLAAIRNILLGDKNA